MDCTAPTRGTVIDTVSPPADYAQGPDRLESRKVFRKISVTL